MSLLRRMAISNGNQARKDNATKTINKMDSKKHKAFNKQLKKSTSKRSK